jgi:SAM-dependent methyltransferase
MLGAMSTYDLDLFLKLNAEWEERPLVGPPGAPHDPVELTQQSAGRARQVTKHVPLEGKRVLEIGCGRGYFVRLLNDEYGCDATGLDVVSYPEWAGDRRFIQADIADPPGTGRYDVIISHAVWEHVERPYTALVNQRKMLARGGTVYLYANLHRGAKASHRYREVYFPWPHLLFTDEVFEAFYEQIGRGPQRAAWVNRLTFAQYVDHFERIGYGIRRVWPSKPWWDEQFYRQHCDVLGRYPEWDLRHDFIHAVLTRDAVPARHDDQRSRIRALERRIEMLESSRSWRLTAPIRAAGRFLRRR